MQDHSTVFIHLLAKVPKLDPQQIQQQHLSPSELYYLGRKGQVWGPYGEKTLGRFLLDQAAHLPANLYYKNAQEKHWHLCRHWHPPTPEQTAKSGLWVILQGQKLGPISAAEVIALLKQGEIFFNDLVSSDGKNWKKIFEVEAFTPHLGGQRLPPTPFAAPDSPTEEAPPPLPRAGTTAEDLLASLAFIKHAELDPPVVRPKEEKSWEEQTGPVHNLTNLLHLPEEFNEGATKGAWFMADWREWFGENQTTLFFYGGIAFVILASFLALRPDPQMEELRNMAVPTKSIRAPASLPAAPAPGTTRVNPHAAQDYAPDRDLPVAATHQDSNGTTIIRYIPDTKKIDQVFRGTRRRSAEERANTTVGESTSPPEAIPEVEEGIPAETTEYETSRLEIEAAREAQERELEALKEEELRKQAEEEQQEQLAPDV